MHEGNYENRQKAMPRTIEANQKIKAERREAILSGALELFVKKGFAGTRISDIAKLTRMSNGLVYHYFSSKEEIFTELTNTAFSRMNQACEHLESLPMAPHEKIRYAMAQLVKTIRSNPMACRYHILITQAATIENVPAGAKQVLHANRHKPHKVIAKIISQGQALSTIRKGPALDLAFFFWNTVNGLAIHQAMYGESAQSPDLEPVYRMFFV